jgi:hypothetical protein
LEEGIIAYGHDDHSGRRVVHLVKNTEFKRKQAALALKVAFRAFCNRQKKAI